MKLIYTHANNPIIGQQLYNRQSIKLTVSLTVCMCVCVCVCVCVREERKKRLGVTGTELKASCGLSCAEGIRHE